MLSAVAITLVVLITHHSILHKVFCAVYEVRPLVLKSILVQHTVDGIDGFAEVAGQLVHILRVLPATPWQQPQNQDLGGGVLLQQVLQVLDDSAHIC